MAPSWSAVSSVLDVIVRVSEPCWAPVVADEGEVEAPRGVTVPGRHDLPILLDRDRERLARRPVARSHLSAQSEPRVKASIAVVSGEREDVASAACKSVDDDLAIGLDRHAVADGETCTEGGEHRAAGAEPCVETPVAVVARDREPIAPSCRADPATTSLPPGWMTTALATSSPDGPKPVSTAPPEPKPGSRLPLLLYRTTAKSFAPPLALLNPAGIDLAVRLDPDAVRPVITRRSEVGLDLPSRTERGVEISVALVADNREITSLSRVAGPSHDDLAIRLERDRSTLVGARGVKISPPCRPDRTLGRGPHHCRSGRLRSRKCRQRWWTRPRRSCHLAVERPHGPDRSCLTRCRSERCPRISNAASRLPSTL